MSISLTERVDAELDRLNRKAKQSIEMRKRRKKRGGCIRCGKPALKPYAQCRNCRERDILRATIRSENRKLHAAAKAGKRKDAAKTYVYLSRLVLSYADGRNAYQRGWYQRRVLFHRCVRCGVCAGNGIVFCDHHAEQHAAYERTRRQNMTQEQRDRYRDYMKAYRKRGK